jgi:hypothetical protein
MRSVQAEDGSLGMLLPLHGLLRRCQLLDALRDCRGFARKKRPLESGLKSLPCR